MGKALKWCLEHREYYISVSCYTSICNNIYEVFIGKVILEIIDLDFFLVNCYQHLKLAFIKLISSIDLRLFVEMLLFPSNVEESIGKRYRAKEFIEKTVINAFTPSVSA